MSNQRNGDQREALFNAIAAYASNIENLPALLPAVEKIAQKHTSFQIKPEQYNIVGEHTRQSPPNPLARFRAVATVRCVKKRACSDRYGRAASVAPWPALPASRQKAAGM